MDRPGPRFSARHRLAARTEPLDTQSLATNKQVSVEIAISMFAPSPCFIVRAGKRKRERGFPH
jgi:hypothetical protein